ncbi:MAG: hypothetical protein NWQ23_07100 [Yoonia sp.]|uniref:hypothetical protein n=1 Tax=Yoonia sp. TaxID=2212373 RepID=UPI00273E5B76|nr:hypothetical protein [Yoonia sp.]MDP5085171.1 hypothetical protein [Yoonia sp.]
MRTRTLLCAAAFIMSATTSYAGGLADQIVETPGTSDSEVVVAGSSINPAYIVLGVLAALLVVAASSDDDDPTPVVTTPPPPAPPLIPPKPL